MSLIEYEDQKEAVLACTTVKQLRAAVEEIALSSYGVNIKITGVQFLAEAIKLDKSISNGYDRLNRLVELLEIASEVRKRI